MLDEVATEERATALPKASFFSSCRSVSFWDRVAMRDLLTGEAPSTDWGWSRVLCLRNCLGEDSEGPAEPPSKLSICLEGFTANPMFCKLANKASSAGKLLLPGIDC